LVIVACSGQAKGLAKNSTPRKEFAESPGAASSRNQEYQNTECLIPWQQFGARLRWNMQKPLFRFKSFLI
jgi:hypothetical protein